MDLKDVNRINYKNYCVGKNLDFKKTRHSAPSSDNNNNGSFRIEGNQSFMNTKYYSIFAEKQRKKYGNLKKNSKNVSMFEVKFEPHKNCFKNVCTSSDNSVDDNSLIIKSKKNKKFLNSSSLISLNNNCNKIRSPKKAKKHMINKKLEFSNIIQMPPDYETIKKNFSALYK